MFFFVKMSAINYIDSPGDSLLPQKGVYDFEESDDEAVEDNGSECGLLSGKSVSVSQSAREQTVCFFFSLFGEFYSIQLRSID